MNYIDFNAGGNDYKLRLNTRAIVTLERQLNKNPLMVFGTGDRVPTISEMVSILHASLQPLHHGITLEKAYDIFDAYLADGNVMTDFIPVIVDVYKASGIIRETKTDDEESEETEKN